MTPSFLTDSVCYKALGDSIGYVSMDDITEAWVKRIADTLHSTKGLILDLREYPNETINYKFYAILSDKSRPFFKATEANMINPGQFTFSKPVYTGKGKQAYPGKIAILIDDDLILLAFIKCVDSFSAVSDIVKDCGWKLGYCFSDLISQFPDSDLACCGNDEYILITQSLYFINEFLCILIGYSVTLVAYNDLGSRSQLKAEFLKFLVDRLKVIHGLSSVCSGKIDNMDQKSCSLDMS